ncbi:MAG: hypothetical protein K2P99_05035 [Burkholderiales bacterium]|nr:hypothetical protein [Burkholderiales bacterium]
MPRNHYLDARIQKRLPNVQDNQVEYTGMKINKHFAICAGTGGGKTNALYDYILQTSKGRGTFHHIYLCYKTEEPLYSDLKEELEGGITTYKSVSAFPSAKDFPDAETTDYKYQFLVIFDDCINDKNKEDMDKIKDYFTFARKKGVTVCFLAQSFFDINIFIRKQLSYLLLLTIKGKTDLRNILRDYGSLDYTIDELYAIYKTATEKRDPNDIPFLKICTENCALNKKFSRDWLEYLIIE